MEAGAERWSLWGAEGSVQVSGSGQLSGPALVSGRLGGEGGRGQRCPGKVGCIGEEPSACQAEASEGTDDLQKLDESDSSDPCLMAED